MHVEGGTTPEAAPVAVSNDFEIAGSMQLPVFDPADLTVPDGPILGSSTAEYGFPPFPLTDYIDNLTEGAHGYSHTDGPLAVSLGSAPSSPTLTAEPSSWEGSSLISEQKHRQLMYEVDLVQMVSSGMVPVLKAHETPGAQYLTIQYRPKERAIMTSQLASHSRGC